MAIVAVIATLGETAQGGFQLPDAAPGWWGLAALTFLYGTAFTIMFTVLPKLGVVGNSAIMNVEPVFALCLAWLVLGQSIALSQVGRAGRRRDRRLARGCAEPRLTRRRAASAVRASCCSPTGAMAKIEQLARGAPSRVPTRSIVEAGERHRDRHLHLEQREIAPRAQPRRRRRKASRRAWAIGARRVAPSASQRSGSKASASGKVARLEGVAPHHADDVGIRRDVDVADRGVRVRLRRQQRRHRLQAHRLLDAGVDVAQLRDRFSVNAASSGTTRLTSSRARAIASGWRCRKSNSQASVLAVVSSPAISIDEDVAGDVAVVGLAARHRRRRSSPRADCAGGWQLRLVAQALPRLRR